MAQQLPPGYAPPQPPKGSGVVKGLLIGCGVFVLVCALGVGIVGYFVWRAVAPTVHSVADTAQGISAAAQGAQQAAAQAGASPSAEQAAAAGIAVLKGLAGGGKSPVATLSREELAAYLPASVGSLQKQGSGSSSKGEFAGISGTNASANYGDSNGNVEIELTDAANMSGLTGMMDLLMGTVTSETDEGYEKTVQLGDVKVHEQWTNSSKHAELIGIVGGRFAVGVDSNAVDMSTAEQAFQAVDIAKLESVAASTAK